MDAAKFTNEVKVILMDQDHDKTTCKWEDFIVEAKVAWRVLEEERGGSQARIIREGSDKDKETKELAANLPDTPSVNEFEDGMSIEEVTFNSLTPKSVPAGTKNSRLEGFLLAKHKHTNTTTMMEPFSPLVPWF